MRVRFFYFAAVMVALFLTCSTMGNAQSYFTYGFYQIVDNTGALLSSTTGAGFNVAGCQYVQATNSFFRVLCEMIPPDPQLPYLHLPLEVGAIGGGGPLCTDWPPPPFAEYDPTQYPSAAACFGASFNTYTTVTFVAGTPRCAPGQAQTNGCELPYIFTATPSANTATGKLVPSQWQVTYTSASTGVQTVVPCLEPNGSLTCTSYPPENGAVNVPFVKLIYAPAVTCVGFQAPFNNPISLPKNSKRALPLTIQLFDQNNNLVNPTTLNAAGPVVSLMYSSGSSPAVVVPSADLLPEGQSSTGNQFTFDSATNTWQFKLDTSPFTAPGTYTVSVQTGDGSQYAISTCSQTFTR